MKKTLMIGACLVMFASAAEVSATGIPVYDGQRSIDFVMQMEQLYRQYKMLEQQLSTAKHMHGSISGNRGYGDLLRNPVLRAKLPQEIIDIYNYTNQSGSSGISGTVDDLLRDEKVVGDVSMAEAQILERQSRHAATNKAVTMRAYEGAQVSIDQIGLMINEINATQDQKAIGELSARIQGQQALLQTELMKLHMIHQLQQTEKELIAQQKRQNARRMLDINNPNVPRITWDSLQDSWNKN